MTGVQTCALPIFAKITLSIRKNISYAYEKTKSRNVGRNRNFIEGLINGRCVCSGYALITKMALKMHGIDADVVYNDIHAWNEVKLGNNWYNWDMTNVKANSLTALTMGKCLMSDEQLKGRMYENKSSTRVCETNASESLITSINRSIKENLKGAPKLPKETFISKIKMRVNDFFSKFGIGKQKLLEEGNVKEKLDISDSSNISKTNYSSIEFTKYNPVILFEDRESALWEIQSWDKGSVDNIIRTSYVELPMIGNPTDIMKQNKEEFLSIYEALVKEADKDNSFIGRISIVPNNSEDENKKHFCGDSFKSKECENILDKVKTGIEMNEKRKMVLQQTNKREHQTLNNERNS